MSTESEKRVFRAEIILSTSIKDIITKLIFFASIFGIMTYLPAFLHWSTPLIPVNKINGVIDFVSYAETYPEQTLFAIVSISFLLYFSIGILLRIKDIIFAGILLTWAGISR